ncbi:MAG: histidine kinase, partial [Cyanobacteria bacterium J06631_2]
ALLAELAHDFFAANELFFTKDRILEYIQVFLSDTSGDAKYIDTDRVLEAIAIQQGILVERAKDIYSFSHLTLQEYLTAKYISQDNRRIENLVQEHLTDERWREVFLLVAGIAVN